MALKRGCAPRLEGPNLRETSNLQTLVENRFRPSYRAIWCVWSVLHNPSITEFMAIDPLIRAVTVERRVKSTNLVSDVFFPVISPGEIFSCSLRFSPRTDVSSPAFPLPVSLSTLLGIRPSSSLSAVCTTFLADAGPGLDPRSADTKRARSPLDAAHCLGEGLEDPIRPLISLAQLRALFYPFILTPLRSASTDSGRFPSTRARRC